MSGRAPVFTADELLNATGGTPLAGGHGWTCRGVSTDTRTLEKGNLFVALAGERFDGHDWLAAAVGKGSAALLIRTERWRTHSQDLEGVSVIGVADTLEALGQIARAWRRRFPVPVVAITGSSGKTSTKEMVTAIAARTRRVLATPGNLNNLIGLPQTLLMLNRDHQLAVVEMGTNSPGEIARLAAIAEPGIGLITNIGPAHLEGLGSLEAVREEKGALFTALAGRGTAVLNQDDEQIAVLARRWRGDRVTFGLTPGAEVTACRIGPAGPQGIGFTLLCRGTAAPVHLPVPGRHNVTNALAAAAVATALGIDPGTIAAGLADYRPIPGRLEIRPLANGTTLIIDTYNANPASVREALRTLEELRGKGRSFAVLGDMLELGPQAEALHREIGKALAAAGVDRVLLKGTLSRATAAGAIRQGMGPDRIAFFEEPADVLSLLESDLQKGDWLLVKGSRKMRLEAVAEAIISAFDRKGETV
jgi:UDP-N-acetylmuramoyl-tripeptide--D-alanyl-D-alanine ligase